MRSENEGTAGRRDLEECIRFHGHFCPGLAIGIRAARALMAALQLEERAEDEELIAMVETDACGADAIQVITGCTFGKGNFIVKDYGKNAFTLMSRKSGRGFRACVRPGAMLKDPERLVLLQKVQNDSATPEEMERFREGHRRSSERVLAMPVEELFEIKEVVMELPPKARVVESDTCDACKESVRIDYLTTVHGRKLCRGCMPVSGKDAV